MLVTAVVYWVVLSSANHWFKRLFPAIASEETMAALFNIAFVAIMNCSHSSSLILAACLAFILVSRISFSTFSNTVRAVSRFSWLPQNIHNNSL